MLLRMPNTHPASEVITSTKPGRMLCWKASDRNDRLHSGVRPFEYPPLIAKIWNLKAKTYSSTNPSQNGGNDAKKVEPIVTTESVVRPRRQPAKTPSRLPRTNAMIVVTPTSMRVHGNACRIVCDTVSVGYEKVRPNLN